MLALAFFAAAGPLGIDMYLPGLPQLQADLGTTAPAVQLTISGFMVGMAVGNLLFGPISDGTGRKRPILISSLVFFVTSVLCAIAPNIWFLVGARFLQGIAGGCVIVVSRAVIPDLSRGTAAARAFSALMALTGFMPAIAPAIGGLLLPMVGWRGIFWLLAAVNLVQVLLALWLPETLPAERRAPGGLRTLFPRIAQCLRRPVFVGYLLACALGFGALFSYISASPLVLQRQLGLSPTAFSLVFGALALSFPLSNALNMRLVKRVAPRRVLTAALLIDVCVAAALIILALAGDLTWWFIPLLALLPMMSGFISANATALAVEDVRDIGAGAGTGAIGFTQFLVAATVAPLASLGTNHALAMAVSSLACAAVALAAVLLLTRTPAAR
nr:multidrug effflux MFS transporter [Corynebacterium stercoris]